MLRKVIYGKIYILGVIEYPLEIPLVGIPGVLIPIGVPAVPPARRGGSRGRLQDFPMRQILEVKDITKYYRLGTTEVRALNGVSFQVFEGELTAIIGSSGSGKSTLMHILGCLDTPTGGTYILNGRDVSTLSPDEQSQIRNANIGFVFQTFNLLPRLTALENVELPLLYSGNRSAKDKAMEALKIVGLAERAHHEPNQLSGGQRQRVAIARALINNPKVIFADEPTGNLDSRTGADILEVFRQLHEQGRTIIMVTHDNKIADFCERRIRISDGRIIEDSQGVAADRADIIRTMVGTRDP